MQHSKILLLSVSLMASCSAPGIAQQTPAATADRPAYCAEYYGCIESRPLSEAEARSSRGYPAPLPSQADIAFRNPRSLSGSGPEEPSPTDPSARSLPPRAAF